MNYFCPFRQRVSIGRGGSQLQQRAALGNPIAGREMQRLHRAGMRRGDGVFHLHCFYHHQNFPRNDRLPRGYLHCDDHSGQRRREAATGRGREEFLIAWVLMNKIMVLAFQPHMHVYSVYAHACFQTHSSESRGDFAWRTQHVGHRDGRPIDDYCQVSPLLFEGDGTRLATKLQTELHGRGQIGAETIDRCPGIRAGRGWMNRKGRHHRRAPVPRHIAVIG